MYALKVVLSLPGAEPINLVFDSHQTACKVRGELALTSMPGKVVTIDDQYGTSVTIAVEHIAYTALIDIVHNLKAGEKVAGLQADAQQRAAKAAYARQAGGVLGQVAAPHPGDA